VDDFGIKGIGGLEKGPLKESKDPKEKAEGSFQGILSKSLKEVNELQNQAEKAIRDLAQGRETDLHRTMVLIEKADLSFRLMMKVRKKLLDAYQEIMRMPL
jgi:flagellar hook-basal body complex protein FliE